MTCAVRAPTFCASRASPIEDEKKSLTLSTANSPTAATPIARIGDMLAVANTLPKRVPGRRPGLVDVAADLPVQLRAEALGGGSSETKAEAISATIHVGAGSGYCADMAALMTFTSHIAGKNATVSIHEDRIEWEQKGRVTATRVLTGAALVGMGRKGGSTEMIPIRHITSVTTRKDGLTNWAVSVVTSGNTVDMRVSKGEAEQIKQAITRLMLS
jgi:hypothetical protein